VDDFTDRAPDVPPPTARRVLDRDEDTWERLAGKEMWILPHLDYATPTEELTTAELIAKYGPLTWVQSQVEMWTQYGRSPGLPDTPMPDVTRGGLPDWWKESLTPWYKRIVTATGWEELPGEDARISEVMARHALRGHTGDLDRPEISQ
jgi:hypothetical protein